jgi:hypothetical protein
MSTASSLGLDWNELIWIGWIGIWMRDCFDICQNNGEGEEMRRYLVVA